jgi:hypothetical protein
LLERIRITAMSNVLPSLGLPSLAVRQSCGTLTVPHGRTRRAAWSG